MKKTISVCLICLLAVMLFGCEKTILRDSENSVIALCDSSAEKVVEMTKSFCAVNAIEYSINNMCFHPSRTDVILLDLTWYIDAEAEDFSEYSLHDYFIKALTLEGKTVTVDNKTYTVTHTSADNKDSLYVSLNGNDPYSGLDAYNEAMQRAADRVKCCCICSSVEADLVPYGCHYYCPEHFEWAKTVVEASNPKE